MNRISAFILYDPTVAGQLGTVRCPYEFRDEDQENHYAVYMPHSHANWIITHDENPAVVLKDLREFANELYNIINQIKQRTGLQ